jgi:hypothetical protein
MIEGSEMATKSKSPKFAGVTSSPECQQLLAKIVPTLKPVKVNASQRPSR